jgi:hypothetical protein
MSYGHTLISEILRYIKIILRKFLFLKILIHFIKVFKVIPNKNFSPLRTKKNSRIFFSDRNGNSYTDQNPL